MRPKKETNIICSENGQNLGRNETDEDNTEEESKDPHDDELDLVNKPTSFSVKRVDQLLRQLEGKLLSYKMFARDTKAARNT